MQKRPIQDFFSFLLICIMLCALIPAEAQTDTMVRVFLRRLQIQDTIHIRVNGAYMLEDGAASFADGTELAVTIRNGGLVLFAGGMLMETGKQMKLVRLATDAERSGLTLENEPGLYEGDLVLSIEQGAIMPVLHIDVEDYLLGVVPYEMGDGFPLEALKAQAIAARTYALNAYNKDRNYDVEDTTNDQAYRGRNTYSPVSEQSVRETAGMYGAYKGKLAKCYYSASNGGQTELAEHIWPTSAPDAYGYMDMRDDPYDLENEASIIRRYTIKKKPGKEGIGDTLHAALVEAMKGQLALLGVPAGSDLIRFDEIVKIETAEPRYDEPSRLMTALRFTVKISTRECTFRDETTPLPEVTPAPDATPTPTPAPTATPAYTGYKKIKEPITFDMPIFPQAEKAMGLSINVSQNELITVVDIGSAYMIESRRYGHGVGMSQRGAQQMAGAHGMTMKDILSFYYPDMEIKTLSGGRTPLPTVPDIYLTTPEPLATPTPRPTLMPVTEEKLPCGAYVAVVSEIDDDSTLNLRESPSFSAAVLRKLYKYQRLIVLETRRDGWAKVKTDVIEGFVKSEFLQKSGENK